jgi:hypothetical protein
VAQGGREDSTLRLENRPGGPPGGSRAAPTYALRVSAWLAPHPRFLILQARRERVYMPQDGRGQLALEEQEGRPSCDASYLTRVARREHTRPKK